MQPLLEIYNLRKCYREIVAVEDVSLSVEPGTCLGILGPNGAGKTTTIEIIEDIIPPTEGEIHYKGQPRSDSFREEIGIQFQHTSLLNFLSVEETLLSFQKLFSKPVDLEQLISRCDLESIRDRRNNNLSGGQLQRLMLALALINDPELIFLDEPSTGLDPQSRRNLWEIVDQIKEEGKTIIMTTHSMEEAEYLCDEVAIMDQGRIIASGPPKKLIQTYCSTNTIHLPLEACLNVSDNLPFQWHQNEDTAIIRTENIDEQLSTMMKSNISLAGMTIHSPNLEDVFLHLTGKTLRD